MNGRMWICALFVSQSIVLGQTISKPYAGADREQLYRQMLASIRQIKIFDDHSHPGFPDDADVDAMVSPPGSSALRIRADNPELIAASKALFAYPYSVFSAPHTAWLVKRK